MKVGPYEVLETVGRGGMGTVLRARGRDGREIAIKVLNPGASTARFERERRLLEAFGEADGFVPLLDAGTDEEGRPFLVMPFVAGGTLRARLSNGPLPIPATVALGRKLAGALAKAHERGVVHRDLKPENVLYTAQGAPLIADLGLAKHFDRDALGASRSVSISRDGQVLGTAGYMPLEQFRDAREVGPEADVFALGAILHECLAGAPAFPGDSAVEVLARLEIGVAAPLRKARPEAPPWLVLAVEKALARDPRARFADGAAVLRALAAGESVPRRRRAASLALAGAAAVALGAAGLVLTRPRAASPPPRVVLPRGYETLAGSKRLALTGLWGLPDGKHAGAANCVAFTPDGRSIVSGGGDSAVRVWEAATGREARSFAAHVAGVRTIALSRDGQRLVTGGGENALEVWDFASGRSLRRIGELRNFISALALSPDGRRAVTVGGDAAVTVWDLDAGVPLDRFETGQRRVNGCALSPDGTRVVTAGDDNTVRVFELATGKELAKLEGHLGPASCVAFAPDGEHVVSGSDAQGVRLWDLRSMTSRWSSAQGANVLAVAVSPDGKRAASAGGGPTILVWDLATGRSTFVIDPGARGAVAALAFSPDSRRLAAAVRDNALRLWELPEQATGTVRELWPPHGHRGQTHAIAISDDGSQVASGGLDGVILLRDGATGAERRTLGEKGTSVVGGIAIAPDGKRMVAGSYDAALRIYETASGRVVKTVIGHVNHVMWCAFLADGKRFVSGATDGTIKVWDLDSAKVLRSITVDSQWLESAALDGARRTVLTGGRDGKVKQWDPDTGALLGTGDTALTAVYSVGADETASRVFSCGNDDRVKVWSWSDRVVLRSLARQKIHTFGLALVSGLLVSARREGPLLLHDTDTGEKVDELPFELLRDQPSAIAASRDGRTLVIGTERGVVLKYEVR